MTVQLSELLEAYTALPEAQRAQLKQDAFHATRDMSWVPNDGPQDTAYFSEADELFYGGEAGGGKSQLLLGLSLTAHTRSLILREFRDDALALGDQLLEIAGSTKGWNGQLLRYKEGNKLIEFAGVPNEKDKQRHKGIPHDLIGFDEIGDFYESQYVFIIGWNRSTTPGQRSRVVATGNPPTRAKGLWVIKRWAAWLDPKHPNPAADGELRWYTTSKDGEIEVDGRGPHLIDGEMIEARSRTFIRAKLADNPDLAETGYDSTLAALPKELRDAYRGGKFDASLKDHPFQVIPTDWIRQAQARWTEKPPAGIPMCAIGVDVAQGGGDQTVLAPRHDGWYAPLMAVPGSDTPNGSDVAGLVISKRRDGAQIIIDVGGGWGTEAYGHLRANDIPAVAYMGVKDSVQRSEEGRLKFRNIRTQAYWRFREALNPDQPQGSPIMLPEDTELVADLTAATFEVGSHGVYVIDKKTLVKQLGRSPDKGDAVVMSWFAGARMATNGKQWNLEQGGRKRAPSVNYGSRRPNGMRQRA